MGFLDDISATFNRGAAATGRTAKTIKLKGQIADVNRRRQSLAAQLGALLYDQFKDDEAVRGGYEELFAGIAACDEERAGYQAEIEEIEAEAAAASEAAKTLECPHCHTRVAKSDLFCSGCGMPIEQIRAAAEERAAREAAAVTSCPRCGAPVGDDDLFCTACGARIDDVPAAEIVQVESVEQIDEPEEAPAAEAAGADAEGAGAGCAGADPAGADADVASNDGGSFACGEAPCEGAVGVADDGDDQADEDPKDEKPENPRA